MNLPRIAFSFSAVTIVMALLILSIVPPIGGYPTITPTVEPTEAPTEMPTQVSTEAPTAPPTEPVTEPPTEAPTEPVTAPPTEAPTEPEPTEPEVRYFDVPLSEELQDYIFYLCDRYEVDPKIVIAMIRKESTYNSDCVGDNGAAIGLMQIQPRWHQERMFKLGVVDLYNPYQNVQAGIDYLAEMLDWGDGSITYALTAYNAGPTYAWELEEQGRVSYYARTVLEYADELEYA
jgi:soluble lytic murein transglycosylase-like protein